MQIYILRFSKIIGAIISAAYVFRCSGARPCLHNENFRVSRITNGIRVSAATPISWLKFSPPTAHRHHSAVNSFFSHYAQTDALNRTRCSSAGGIRVGDNTSIGRPGTDVVYNDLTCPSDACGRLLYKLYIHLLCTQPVANAAAIFWKKSN